MDIINTKQEVVVDGDVRVQEIKDLKHPIHGQSIVEELPERDRLAVVAGQHQWYAYNEHKIIPWIFFS